VAADGLTPGETHFFRLEAVNQVATSEASDEASFAVAPVPSQMANKPVLVVENSTLTQLLIRWTGQTDIPSTNTEIGVTGYRLYMDGGNDGLYTLVYDGTN
jgi:hypothetical protein